VERNVISLQSRQRTRRVGLDPRLAAAFVLVAVEALLFVGLVGAFLLTRAAAAAAWPPPGQPWFPPGKIAINTAALLASGALVSRAARTWDDPEARIAPVLFTAVLLGGFFLFFQGVLWVEGIGEGLRPTASHHGRFFCLIVAMHAAHTLGALALLGIVWLRLAPLRDDGAPRRRSLRDSAFSAARVPWYFAVASWPLLYVTLFL
jgi:heme/copper-type cytochrome/quinol oxidase subunit 3